MAHHAEINITASNIPDFFVSYRVLHWLQQWSCNAVSGRPMFSQRPLETRHFHSVMRTSRFGSTGLAIDRLLCPQKSSRQTRSSCEMTMDTRLCDRNQRL
jgi:hypothetical protein